MIPAVRQAFPEQIRCLKSGRVSLKKAEPNLVRGRSDSAPEGGKTEAVATKKAGELWSQKLCPGLAEGPQANVFSELSFLGCEVGTSISSSGGETGDETSESQVPGAKLAYSRHPDVREGHMRPFRGATLCPHPSHTSSLPVSFLFHFHSFSPSPFYMIGRLRVARGMRLSLALTQGGATDTPRTLQPERLTKPGPESTGEVCTMTATPRPLTSPSAPFPTGPCLPPTLLVPDLHPGAPALA